ncbi:CDP-alcohol phosphatidyltransferase family protein [Nostoc ellipsosporum NOK]|nr:CDP-alcohol phosphatidyltransferase family protein [Nostoc ellipsosporum NOK]
MKQVPNFFTLLNLVFGCIAIVYVLQNGISVYVDTNGVQVLEVPEEIWMASLFIGLAGVVDFLDGFLARLLRADSEMGAQLDSLSDVVSFGVAPGMILYQFLRNAVARQEDGLDASFLWLVPAFVVAAAAAWRLARFNLDKSQQFSFKGLPAPAAGLLVASLPLIYWNSQNEMIVGLLRNKWFLYAVIAVVSYLMVSTLPLMSLKFKDYSLKNNIPKLLLLIIAVAAGLLLQWLAVPIVIIAYILLSLVLKTKTA